MTFYDGPRYYYSIYYSRLEWHIFTNRPMETRHILIIVQNRVHVSAHRNRRATLRVTFRAMCSQCYCHLYNYRYLRELTDRNYLLHSDHLTNYYPLLSSSLDNSWTSHVSRMHKLVERMCSVCSEFDDLTR